VSGTHSTTMLRPSQRVFVTTQSLNISKPFTQRVKRAQLAMCDRCMAYLRPICVDVKAHACPGGNTRWECVAVCIGIILHYCHIHLYTYVIHSCAKAYGLMWFLESPVQICESRRICPLNPRRDKAFSGKFMTKEYSSFARACSEARWVLPTPRT